MTPDKSHILVSPQTVVELCAKSKEPHESSLTMFHYLHWFCWVSLYVICIMKMIGSLDLTNIKLDWDIQYFVELYMTS